MLDEVREAEPRDDRALRELSRACPMRGPVSYCLERAGGSLVASSWRDVLCATTSADRERGAARS